MQAFTIENDVLAGVIGPVGPGDTTIGLRAPVAPFRAPPSPLDAGRPGILTIVDRLSLPTAIEVITYTSRTINPDGSVTLGGITRGQQGTTARSWTNAAQAYQAPTRDQLQQSVIGAAIGSAADAAAVRALIGAGTGNGSVTSVGANLPLTSSGGTAPTIGMPAATSGNDGYMTGAQAAKLGGIEPGAQVNVGTNLGVGGTGNTVTLTSSTGSDTNLPLASGAAAGLMSLEQHTKLAGIAEGATAYTNAMVRAQIESMVQAGTNVTFSFSGTGDTRTLTINSTGGGAGGSPGSPDRSIQFNNAGAFAGSEQLKWSADFTGLVVPAVYGYQRTFVTGVLDPEVGTAAVATETMAVTEVGGIASWQLQLRDRAGGGLVRLRLQSDDAGPQISFGSGDFVPVWHGENFNPTQGPEVENVSGTTYNFTNADSGKYKRATSTSAKTFVIDSTVTALRWECHVHNAGATGSLTISGAGVSINGTAGGSVSLPPGAFATLRRTDSGAFDALVAGLPASGGLTHFTESVNTSAPNATVPAVQLLATNAATNVDVALTAKGAGALLAHIPDNTSTGGNKRGQNAVDLQRVRNNANQVASGNLSIIVGGDYNRASSTGSICVGGQFNISSSTYTTVVGGTSNNCSGSVSFIGGGASNVASSSHCTVSGGEANQATGAFSWIPGGRSANTRSLIGGYAWSGAVRASNGDNQCLGFTAQRTTTDATPTILTADRATPLATNCFALPNNSCWTGTVHITGRSSGADVYYLRLDVVGARGANAAATTVKATNPAYTFTDTGLVGVSAAVVANTTRGSLEVEVTGLAATTIDWFAHFAAGNQIVR